ncbi:MAG: helix-turn-helix domain-containing protein, partial [Victivallaceae bacterium]|nr:helix-turn-helix domain-containing protein [Victivallaceae bacterium]
MSHLTEQDRCKIQNLLNAGDLPREIAFKIGKNPSTIQREIRKHRHEDEANHKHIRNFCSQRKQCYKRILCKLPPQNCPGRCSICKIFSCNKHCSSFTEDSCRKLDRSPYVCNGCQELKGCQKRKYYYIASTAMNEYLTLLSEGRQGIDVSPTEIQQYNELIKAGGKNGQGIHHIMAAH